MLRQPTCFITKTAISFLQLSTSPSKQPCTNPNPARFGFEGAELVSTPVDPSKIAKFKNLPYREGTGPLTHTKPVDAFSIVIDAIAAQFREEPPQNSSDQSRGGGGTSWVNPRKHTGGTTLSNTTKHDFRDLKGRRDISLASRDKRDHLQAFQDPGGAPQHRNMGCMPMADARPIPWTPREVVNTMEAEKDEAATRTRTVGRQMWLRGPGDLFWESFPSLININKWPSKIYKQTYQQHKQLFTHTLKLCSD